MAYPEPFRKAVADGVPFRLQVCISGVFFSERGAACPPDFQPGSPLFLMKVSTPAARKPLSTPKDLPVTVSFDLGGATTPS